MSKITCVRDMCVFAFECILIFPHNNILVSVYIDICDYDTSYYFVKYTESINIFTKVKNKILSLRVLKIHTHTHTHLRSYFHPLSSLDEIDII